MVRQSYVQIKTGDRYKLVPKGGPEHLEFEASQRSGLMIIGDIEPYRSTIDGTVITSRSRHRDHLRAHGCVEVGNEWVDRRPPQITSAAPDLARAFDELRK